MPSPVRNAIALALFGALLTACDAGSSGGNDLVEASTPHHHDGQRHGRHGERAVGGGRPGLHHRSSNAIHIVVSLFGMGYMTQMSFPG